MKIYRYIGYLFFAFATSIMSACTDEDMLGQSGDSVNITFRPSLGGELNTRAIGDATGIDQLVVAVYERDIIKNILLFGGLEHCSARWYNTLID